MAIDLTILYDGTSDALRAHRFSVAELGGPLQLLLTAVQRTASAILSQAVDDTSYGARGGRLAAAAKRLDIQISAVSDGCIRLHTEIVQEEVSGENIAIPGLDLAETTLVRLLDDLDAEAKGSPRNAAARKYLRALPPSITRQHYVAQRDGVVLREAMLGEVNTPPDPSRAPRILRPVGIVSAVGLEPDHETVTIKGETGTQAFTATALLLERALTLRNHTVRATAVVDETNRARLLRIDEIDADVAGTPDARLLYIAENWKDALAALAK